MAAIEKRLARLEHDRAVLQALSKTPVLRVVHLDSLDDIDYNDPPVLIIYPGLLEQLRGDAPPVVELQRKG